MSLASVLQSINDNIIPNNNNEITANILRPILIEMLQQPNDLIGLLSNLNTSDNTTLVGAINELKSDLDQLNNITIYQGVGNPNNNTSLSPNIADFYSELDLGNNPIDLWIYNGVQWVSVSNDNPVSYSPQTPSTIEQQTARDNVDVYSRGEVDDAIEEAVSEFIVPDITTKNETISEEGQSVIPDANQNIIRFTGLVTGTTIQPGVKNGDQLVLINKSSSETAFNINIPVVLQTAVDADVFSVQPNTNYMFWFDLNLSRWIDVSL